MLKIVRAFILSFAAWSLFFACPLLAQQAGKQPPPSSAKKPAASKQDDLSLERAFLKNILRDQKDIWTSPARLRGRHLVWLVPVAAATAGSFKFDHEIYNGLAAPSAEKHAVRFSDAGVVALGGVVVGGYLMGRIHDNGRAREMGVLGTQSLVNSMIVSRVLKHTLRRKRPFEPVNSGDFFAGGDSFPSDHTVVAWSLATSIAHQYPGPLTKFAVYGLASSTSLARVVGRKHFPSDVLVGSVLGYTIGRQVYRAHHDHDLPGENIGDFTSDIVPLRDLGSVAVPMDSWVYPAMDRLAALGAVHSAFAGLRPWSRLEVARQLNEANDSAAYDEVEVAELVDRLKAEFRPELDEMEGRSQPLFRLRKVYARLRHIAGPPLHDGYHFGQTFSNDFGRPYQEGINAIAGVSLDGSGRNWFWSVNAEYQDSPSGPGYSPAIQAALRANDQLPLMPFPGTPSVRRVRMLDAYAGLKYAGWQFTLGTQSLYWGPAASGALNLSANAEPVRMFRINRETPLVMPGILHWFGPVRFDFFFGQVQGHKFVRTSSGFFTPKLRPQPFLYGGKFSFKPTKNLELGFSTTTMFGGPGFPITWRTFLRSLRAGNTLPGQPNDPGDRRAGFDFSYKLPFLRDRVTLYNDSMTEDEISPIGYPRRSAMNPGIYISRLPGLARADLRVEGYYTDLPGLRNIGSYYFNSRYLNGFTNYGELLGHPIGRQGSGGMAQATYWFDAVRRLDLAYRKNKLSPSFIPGGGDIDQLSGRLLWDWRKKTLVDFSLQYEDWKVPLLRAAPARNVGVTLQVSYSP